VIASFFEHAWREGARAVGASRREHRLSVADRNLGLRFAGPGLEAMLLPAFGHLQAESAATPAHPVDLEIVAWDSASTGVALEAPPWDWTQGVQRGEVCGTADARFSAQYQIETGMLGLADRQARRGILWLRDARARSRPEAAPLLGLLSTLLAPSVRVVHAGAVGTSDGGVLLAGPGGSGKSTSVLACLGSGLRVAGDDYVAVRAGVAPSVHSLYASAKLDARSLRLLPALRGHVAFGPDTDSAKALVLLAEARPEALIEAFPLRAIVLPCVTGGPTRLVAVTPMHALRTLAPSTLLQLPSADAGAALDTMGDLVRALPAFRLETGPDLDAIPQLLSALVAERREASSG
jgi:hypothetical protein